MRKFEQLFSPGPRLISGDEDDSSSITSHSSTSSLPANPSYQYGAGAQRASRRPPGFERTSSLEIPPPLPQQRSSAPPMRRDPSYNSYHHHHHQQPSSYTVGVPAEKGHYPLVQGIPMYNHPDTRSLAYPGGSSYTQPSSSQSARPLHKSPVPAGASGSSRPREGMYSAPQNVPPYYPMGLSGPPQAAYTTQSSSSSQNSRGSQQSQPARGGPNSVSSVSSSSNASSTASNASNRSAARAPQGSDQFIKFVTRIRLIEDYEDAIKHCTDNKYLFEAESSKVCSSKLLLCIRSLL